MTNSSKPRPTLRRARAVSAAALAAGVGISVLAGCGNGVQSETGDAAPTETVSVTPTPTPSSSGSASPGTSAGSGSSGDGSSSAGSDTGSSGGTSGSGGSGGTGGSGPAICTASHLEVHEEAPAGNGGGTAGSVYTILSFENTGSSTCVLDGHPGVSFVGGGDGGQLGRGATFLGPTKRVRIAPGTQQRAQLRIASPGPYGDECAPVAADGFRVYPPDSRASVFVRDSSYRACSKDLPGGKSQLSVTAVGASS